jgi:hypothetical protein
MSEMFPAVERLKELLKSYYIAKTYDANLAQSLLTTINDLRFGIAIDAEQRQIFYGQLTIPAILNDGGQDFWFSKNDQNYTLRRAVASLDNGVTVSLINQGARQKIITREPVAWQELFADIFNRSSSPIGQIPLFDFPLEIMLGENEAIGVSLQGTTAAGFIMFHGSVLKERLDTNTEQYIKDAIAQYLPQPQLIPLLFQFADGNAGTPATNPNGGNDILSVKNDKDTILTSISTTAPSITFSLIDEGRNQVIADNVPIRGCAADFSSSYSSYFDLPYPHLLRKGDRLRLRATNGNDAGDVIQYVTLSGFSM